LLVGWGLLVWWALRRGAGSRQTLVISAVLLALALLLLAATWGLARLRPPAAALLLAPPLGGLVRGGEQGLLEQRERAYLHQLLARRISPTLLQDILREPGPIWTQVGGSRCRCVVLFTDLVGFTTLSARLEPAPLFSLLNRYFEAIASAMIEEQGLVDKFIGVALMAEFGVPPQPGRCRGSPEP
jgi:adenylate cyclase